ncbi:hypothetical protein G6F46_011769 [Rhizopus delemar]|nr:hypothetical protein G6F43_009393 [Rhizopus delemar]KAG1534907.1 hypothetical protein G6F51_011826 [Rhizopus arrhizus]KAG1446683.1 hypothetical protein G6F55_011436 [Rhizopus delemar]KAG1489381.1 hypothetical protein G6F54_011477 [Rhizopus delemar]KAG1507546.1 hypothetical protein G6F53_008867 [Rhizopus delemar]
MDIARQLIQQSNLASLLGLHLSLSLFGSIATNPTYNLPIFFFGTWAYNYRDSNSPLKTFTLILGLSVLLDLIWFYLHSGNPQGESGYKFAIFFNTVSFIFKPISIYASMANLQERGDSISAGNWTEAPGAFPAGGYQNVRDGDNTDFA